MAISIKSLIINYFVAQGHDTAFCSTAGMLDRSRIVKSLV